MTDTLAVLASPIRREILRLIWTRERSAGAIARSFEISWPGVSQNLRVLRAAGLIKERREGTSRFYRADRDALRPLESYLVKTWSNKLKRLGSLAEAEEGIRSKR